MDILLYVALVLVAISVLTGLRRRENVQDEDLEPYMPKYAYKRKQFIMTKAENEFYQVLKQVVGIDYIIVPQAHLNLFLDHRTKGQDWRAALSVIQRKSVDFLICSRGYHNPLVAIELDEASHRQVARIERDILVEAICDVAGMPLVRIDWRYKYDTEEILSSLAKYLK